MKTDAFALRHIGPSESDLDHMFKTIGIENLEQLIYETIPDNILLKNPLNLDAPMTEYEYLTHIQELGKKNKLFKSYIGLGYHPTIVPAVIQRNIFENPGWYTAYTPYQAEIAQGRLEAILNFQTTVIELTEWKSQTLLCLTKEQPQPKLWLCFLMFALVTKRKITQTNSSFQKKFYRKHYPFYKHVLRLSELN